MTSAAAYQQTAQSAAGSSTWRHCIRTGGSHLKRNANVTVITSSGPGRATTHAAVSASIGTWLNNPPNHWAMETTTSDSRNSRPAVNTIANDIACSRNVSWTMTRTERDAKGGSNFQIARKLRRRFRNSIEAVTIRPIRLTTVVTMDARRRPSSICEIAAGSSAPNLFSTTASTCCSAALANSEYRSINPSADSNNRSTGTSDTSA